jgi:dihydroorotate dehydrogenase electron transfer subunit
MRLEILNNVFLKEHHLLLELSVPLSFKAASPGQFLHVRISGSSDPLLRRPLSIHDISGSRKKNKLDLRILYEIVGKGTALLSEKRPLSLIDAIGPLGNGFDLGRIKQYEKIYIVAGGMGVAPLFFLARKIAENQMSKSKDQMVILIGGRTKEYILREKEFKDLGCQVHIATEDGSKGFKGRVTELLKSFLLSTIDYRLSTICACGPKPMLAAISNIARTRNMTAYVSLEEFMGCGLGACLGCVIRTTSGYKRICHDGPVFDSSEIIWSE